MLPRDLNANQGTLQSYGSAVPIEVRLVRGKAFLGAFFGFFGAGHIDILRALGGLCEYRNAILQHLGESANDGEALRTAGACGTVTQLADAQFGNQRRVAGQNAQSSFQARKGDLDDRLANELSLRRHNDQLDGFGKHLSPYPPAFIFSAFARTSSMVPTM